MKTAIKTMMLGIAACAFAAPAFAYTLSGTIPPHAPPKSVVLHPHMPLPPLVRLTMSAPPVNAGVSYALTYCIGPAANPMRLARRLDRRGSSRANRGPHRAGVVEDAFAQGDVDDLAEARHRIGAPRKSTASPSAVIPVTS